MESVSDHPGGRKESQQAQSDVLTPSRFLTRPAQRIVKKGSRRWPSGDGRPARLAGPSNTTTMRSSYGSTRAFSEATCQWDLRLGPRICFMEKNMSIEQRNELLQQMLETELGGV